MPPRFISMSDAGKNTFELSYFIGMEEGGGKKSPPLYLFLCLMRDGILLNYHISREDKKSPPPGPHPHPNIILSQTTHHIISGVIWPHLWLIHLAEFQGFKGLGKQLSF